MSKRQPCKPVPGLVLVLGCAVDGAPMAVGILYLPGETVPRLAAHWQGDRSYPAIWPACPRCRLLITAWGALRSIGTDLVDRPSVGLGDKLPDSPCAGCGDFHTHYALISARVERVGRKLNKPHIVYWTNIACPLYRCAGLVTEPHQR